MKKAREYEERRRMNSFYGNNLKSFNTWSNGSILSQVIKGSHRHSHHFHRIFYHHLGPIGRSDCELYPTPSLTLHCILYFEGVIDCGYEGVIDCRYLFGGISFSLGDQMCVSRLSPSLIIGML